MQLNMPKIPQNQQEPIPQKGLCPIRAKPFVNKTYLEKIVKFF